MRELIALIVDATKVLGSAADVAEAIDVDPAKIYAWIAANGAPVGAERAQVMERLRKLVKNP
jgi:hypothetical protein